MSAFLKNVYILFHFVATRNKKNKIQKRDQLDNRNVSVYWYITLNFLLCLKFKINNEC